MGELERENTEYRLYIAILGASSRVYRRALVAEILPHFPGRVSQPAGPRIRSTWAEDRKYVDRE